LNNRGQFSIIAALLVGVILIATVIVTYSSIRNTAVRDQPPIQSAIDETNFAIKQILGFTVGYYGSVLQITGNSTYAKSLATNYFQSGLVNVANMHPEWGTSFNVSNMDLHTFWFTNASYSSGILAVTYNLTGLGISGIAYETSCKLGVQVMNTTGSQAFLNVAKDEDEPLINLGKQNFKFYRYQNSTSTWELTNQNITLIAYANGTYQIDLPPEIDPNSYIVQIEDPRGIIVVASSYSRYTCELTWMSQSPTRYAVTASTPEITGLPDGNYKTVGKNNMCEVTDYQGGIGAIKQVYFNITYYGNVSGTLAWAYRLDAGTLNTIGALAQGGSAASPKTATYNATNLRTSWTWSNLNATDIQFQNNGGSGNDDAFVDSMYVTLVVDIPDFSTIPNETIMVELLQNGTMRWLGQNLQLTTQTKPLPPISVKSIHVNQTINGVNSEVPFQIEDWASEYRIPLGLANNASVFSSRNMLVFLATPRASKVTIWWNGSDAAMQTPYAYQNRYFTGDDPGNAKLTNGILTLRFQSGFQVNSTVNSSSTIATFMRINTEDSTYGSNLSYTITNGVVRDVIHQEAEWNTSLGGGGAKDCPNLYAHIVLTLPANATYYTYQLRLMFVQSQQKRNITDLSLILLKSLTGITQTENGTANSFPTVSNGTGVFYNYSASTWAHHWCQSISGTKGAGIMFTDSSNHNLYTFDAIAGNKTGAVRTDATAKIIEILPVTLTPANFTYALDTIWYGAVVTFDGTTPIYKENGSIKTGLWMFVEYPPTVTVSTGS
jgi:uncharacterized protein (UPF0333 family)